MSIKSSYSYIAGMILLAILIFCCISKSSLNSNKIDASNIVGEPMPHEVTPSVVVKIHSNSSKYLNIALDDLRKMVKAGDKGALEELLVRMNVQTRESKLDVYAPYSGTKSQENELWAWREARGYARNNAGDAQYGSYNHEALSKLMNTGDVRALEEMSRRLLDINYINAIGIDIRTALDLRSELEYKAAVYGSTNSLSILGAEIQSSASAVKGSPEMKLAKIDEFAWYVVAAKRGDVMPLHSSIGLLSDLYNISFTENDWAQISEKADERYKELEQKRSELGLGAFDNSVPSAVQSFFDALYPKPKKLPDFMP